MNQERLTQLADHALALPNTAANSRYIGWLIGRLCLANACSGTISGGKDLIGPIIDQLRERLRGFNRSDSRDAQPDRQPVICLPGPAETRQVATV